MTAAEQASLFAPEPSQTLDCRGMQCPAPILELSKAARATGKQPAVLEIIVDDADFPQDLKAWCRASKNQLLHIAEQDGIFVAHVGVNIGEEGTPSSGTRPADSATVRPPRPAVPVRPATPETGIAQQHTSPVVPREAVDCRGMQCPAPILAVAKKAQLFHKQPAFLDITATDGDFPTDLRAWCKAAKAQLVALEESDGCYEALVALNGAEIVETQHTGQSSNTLQSRAVAPSSSATGVQPPAVPPAVPPGVVAVTPTPESQTIDLRGLTTPEPMSQLSRVASTSPVGVSVTVLADDPAFLTDVMTWALATKVEVLSINRQGQTTVASLRFAANSDATTAQASNVVLAAVPANQQTRSTDAGGAELAVCGTHSALSGATQDEQNIAPRENLCSILIIKNDFESLMAALMVATTSAAQGMEVNVFFSFWGVNLLRGERPRRDVAKQKVSVLQKMMQWMMPRGPQRQKMSKMHMGGMGKGMMQYFMKKNNVLTLEELMAVAVEQNVQFTICSMSMGIMGIQKRDIVDFPNVQFAGVTSFVETSRRASMSLVF